MSEGDKPLYPFHLIDEGEDLPWGHVSYKLADLGFKDSMIESGWLGGNTLSELIGTYFERVVGDNSFEFYGTQFPVMLKVIEAKAFQPLQVNVADDVAQQRYDSFGKTALWYVEEARQDARIALGFNKDVPAEEFYRRCKDGTVQGVLNIFTPRKGDAFLIKPGTVFAAGPGLKILEIAESSEMTFQLAELFHQHQVDASELMLDEAFDLIDFKKYCPAALRNPLHEVPKQLPYTKAISSCDEFSVSRIGLQNLLHVSVEDAVGFTVYYCLSGKASVQVPKAGSEPVRAGTMPLPENLDRYELREGQILLMPAEVTDFYLVPAEDGTDLLEIVVDNRKVRDSYTNENVEPSSFGDVRRDDSTDDNAPDPHVGYWN